MAPGTWRPRQTDARLWETAAGFAQGERNWREQQRRDEAEVQQRISQWIAEHRKHVEAGSAHGERESETPPSSASDSESEEVLFSEPSNTTFDPEAQDTGGGLNHFLTREELGRGSEHQRGPRQQHRLFALSARLSTLSASDHGERALLSVPSRTFGLWPWWRSRQAHARAWHRDSRRRASDGSRG